MKIEDNFLDQDSFNELEDYIFGKDCAWYYLPALVDKNNEYEISTDQFQFTHAFFNKNEAQYNAGLTKINPILKLIDPMAIYRILASMRIKSPTVVESLYHVDVGDGVAGKKMPEEKMKQWTTSIFYMNTTNGYTKFEDGTKVECVANRLITFPMNTRHCGTAASNKNKILINFNYFK